MNRRLDYMLLLSLLVGLPAMVFGAFATRATVGVLALGLIALLGAIAGLVVRYSRLVSRQILRINKTAGSTRTALVPSDSGVGAVIRGAEQRTSAQGDWKNHPEAVTLLQSGIFDPEFYAASSNARFNRAIDAASHYLNIGAGKNASPNPFLVPSELTEAVRGKLAIGEVGPLLDFLRGDPAKDAALNAVVSHFQTDAEVNDARLHPGGWIGLISGDDADCGPQMLAPIHPDAPPREAMLVRDLLIHQANDFYASRQLVNNRETSSWDSNVESAWIRELGKTTAPCPDLVSVIMPVKNRADVVAEAMRSVIAQTHRQWELIVVDDGSTDDTVRVATAMSQEDSRIRVISNPGKGVSAARNAGIDSANGEWFAFLDSDNQWTRQFLDLMLRGLGRTEAAAGYAAVSLQEGAGRVRFRAFEGSRDHLMMLNHIDLNVLVVSARVARDVARFDETLRRWVDHDYVLQLAAHTELVLLPFIGCSYEHSDRIADRITRTESEHWQWVVLGKHWADLKTSVRSGKPGMISVIIPTYNDSRMTIDAVKSVLDDASASDIATEVVVVDNGSNMEAGAAIIRAVGGDPRVRYMRLPRNLNFAIGCNYGALRAAGEYLYFLNNDTITRKGALGALVSELEDSHAIGVQPLLLYGDETIQTAGTAFLGKDSLPNHLLTGHPPADATVLRGVSMNAITAAALMVRREDFLAVDGFDPMFVNGMEDVDFCLRAREHFGRGFRVVPSAIVTHLESKTPGRGTNVLENRRIFLERWRGRLDMNDADRLEQVTPWRLGLLGTDGRSIPGPKPVLIRAKCARRRWGIHIASIPGAKGDGWGDTHFADSLACALRRQGQEVVIHRHGAHATSARAYDDVSLVIRGLDRVAPMPGKVNILWVISHPEMITQEELGDFQLRYAASVKWARTVTERYGWTVNPLLQATDTQRFGVDGPRRVTPRPLFVGGVHPGRERKVVRDALDAGLDIEVFGPGWRERIPNHNYGGEYVPNGDLAEYYRGSSVVFADHWSDMAEQGFIQNRIFDALACGARVISDPVEGMAEMFGGAVLNYSGRDDLARQFADANAFDSASEVDERLRVAEMVRAHHSFDARASELVRAVEQVSADAR